MTKFLRVADITSTSDKSGRYPISAATWWKWVKAKKAPQPIRLGSNVTAWSVDELEKWEASQIEAGFCANAQVIENSKKQRTKGLNKNKKHAIDTYDSYSNK